MVPLSHTDYSTLKRNIKTTNSLTCARSCRRLAAATGLTTSVTSATASSGVTCDQKVALAMTMNSSSLFRVTVLTWGSGMMWGWRYEQPRRRVHRVAPFTVPSYVPHTHHLKTSFSYNIWQLLHCVENSGHIELSLVTVYCSVIPHKIKMSVNLVKYAEFSIMSVISPWRQFSAAHISKSVTLLQCLFITMFFRKINHSYHHKTYEQWLWNHAVKFSRWQTLLWVWCEACRS